MANFTEGFDNISTLTNNGWLQRNNSSPLGDTGWLQGVPTTFISQSGSSNSYISANFNNVGNSQPAAISNWLLTPTLKLENGKIVSFYTRSTGSESPDRLQVRLSLNGSSSNIGVDVKGVGDFSTLLLDINPNLTKFDYPKTFTQYNLTLAGIPAPTSGRLAFRYFIPDNAGSSGLNGDFIGIDTFSYGSPQFPFEIFFSLVFIILFGIGVKYLFKKFCSKISLISEKLFSPKPIKARPRILITLKSNKLKTYESITFEPNKLRPRKLNIKKPNKPRTRKFSFPYFRIFILIAIIVRCAFASAADLQIFVYNQIFEIIHILPFVFVPSLVGAISAIVVRNRLFSTKEDSHSELKELTVRLISGVFSLLNFLVIYGYRIITISGVINYSPTDFTIFTLPSTIFFFWGLIAATATGNLRVIFWLKFALIINIPLILVNPFLPFYSIIFFLPIIIGLVGRSINNAFLSKKYNVFRIALILVLYFLLGIGLVTFLKLEKISLFSRISIFGLGGFLILMFLIDIVKHRRC